MTATARTRDEILAARRIEDEEGEFEWSGVVIRCYLCGADVEITVGELNLDGTAPTRYICAECDD